MKNFCLRSLMCLGLMLLTYGTVAQTSRKLTGEIIGTKYSVDYDNNNAQSTTVNTKEDVFDGDFNTFFASYDRNNTWVGLDLGKPYIITRVGWSPRIANSGPERCQLAVFEGANDPDFLDAVPLVMITDQRSIKAMHYLKVNVSRGFRYVRYVGPNDARCNLSELAFYGYEGIGDDSQFYQITNLPTITIHTYTGENPQKKGEDFDANISIIYNGGTLIQESPITTRVRGNGSATFPKKPYRVKFISKSQRVLKDSPLESPAKSKKWTLINNYSDKGLMRNFIAFEMSRRLGFAYTPWGQPVDVIMNGEYQGNYQLCDQITVDPNRLNITEMESTDIEYPYLTGGYLVEVDAYANQEPSQSWFTSSTGIPVTIKSPDEDEIVSTQYNYIKGFFNEMETRAYADNYTDPEKGYRSRLDLTSFLKHFIVGEFAGNLDTYWSVYMYKERSEARFRVGPCWDFDLAFDNARAVYPINERTDWVYKNGSAASNMRTLVNRILSDPYAVKEMRKIWKNMRDSGAFEAESLNAFVDSMGNVLNESQALNFKRWKILSTAVQSNPRVPATYKEEVEFLKNYITGRIAWIDKKLEYVPGAVDDGAGKTFEIANVEDLINFANKVNNGMVCANAILKADLNLILYQSRLIPIGSESDPYKGTFDGQGHVLKNLGSMLFGTTDGATIKNVGIEGGRVDQDLIYASHTGTLVGTCLENAPTTISNCYSKVNLLGATKDAGGLVGRLYGTLSNCYYAGSIRVASPVVGGLVGSCYSGSEPTEIDHCYVSSTQIKTTDGSANCGALVGNLYSGSKVYCCYSTEVVDNLFGVNSGNELLCYFSTGEEFASGSVCWQLNDSNEDTPVWYQTLGEDSYPVLDATHGVVVYKDNIYINEGNAIENTMAESDRLVDVYDARGQLVRKAVSAKTGLQGLPHGIYIVGGIKVIL